MEEQGQRNALALIFDGANMESRVSESMCS